MCNVAHLKIRIMTALELKQIIDENKVKLTAPQKDIIDMLLRGYKIVLVNKHRGNGGSMMWHKEGYDYPEYAGKVYKAFFNTGYQIEKQTGIEFKIGKHFINNEITFNGRF